MNSSDPIRPLEPSHVLEPDAVDSCPDDDNPLGDISVPRPAGRCARALVMAGFTLGVGMAWIAVGGANTDPQTTTLFG